MGFFKSIGNAISSVVPKVTVGDPTKLVTNAINGVTNAGASVIGNSIGQTVGLASQAVGGVGEVMSQPGAGAVLGAAGAAFGVPGLGNLGGLMGSGASASPQSSAAPIVISAPAAESSKDNTSMMIMAGGGLLVIVMILILTMRKR